MSDIYTKYFKKAQLGTALVQYKKGTFGVTFENRYDEINHYVESIGLCSVGNEWIELSAKEAENIMMYIACYSFCYRTKMSQESKAKSIIKSYLKQYSSKTLSYYTNLKLSNYSQTPKEISKLNSMDYELLDPLSMISIGVVILGQKEHGIFSRHETD